MTDQQLKIAQDIKGRLSQLKEELTYLQKKPPLDYIAYSSTRIYPSILTRQTKAQLKELIIQDISNQISQLEAKFESL